ncbi:MAG: exodeoxyribonuclease III [Firmicutes bacterium]|nr:exodeoxyribonuclease III [Bacillota bacterium]
MNNSLKITSWNVNSLKVCLKNGFEDFVSSSGADILCLQEIKTDKIDLPVRGYHEYWNSGKQKGYAGVLILTKQKPLDIIYGVDNDEFDNEGRCMTLEFKDYYIVNIYVPTSVNKNLERYYFRLDFDEAFRAFVENLMRYKPVIICGDFNVAHQYIDINANCSRNVETPPGFLPQEREGFEQLLSLGLFDVYRHLNPDKRIYTWFSNYKAKDSKERRLDFGSRIDYFLVSNELIDCVQDATIHSDIEGSDHCPISLLLSV